MDIWFVERAGSGWSDPVNGGPVLNTLQGEANPSFTDSGKMYFSSNRDGGKGNKDIYVSTLVDGEFTAAVNAGDFINTEYTDGDPFVAPDESYLIYSSDRVPEGRGIYISFRSKDGRWTRGVKMTSRFPKLMGGSVTVTADNKYLFFAQGGDIWWVDARIIDTFKPQDLN